MGKTKSKSVQQSKSENVAQPLSPGEVAGYFNQLNSLTGGKLRQFARQGTQPVSYDALSPDDIRALGGLGASRENQVSEARRQAIEEITADPSLTMPQRLRAKQLADREAQNRLDAILKETEGAITQTAERQAKDKFEAAMQNAKLTREDLEALADIYFGGKGNRARTTSTSSGSSKQKEGLSDFISFGIDI